MNTELYELEQSLNKAVIATGNLPDSMQVTPNDTIISQAFSNAPFLNFLESKGRTADVDTSEISFYKKTAQTGASFIAETADVPDAGAVNIQEVVSRMKTVVSPIEISKMAKMGTNKADLLQMQIEDSYLYIENVIDTTLLTGTGTAQSNDFKNVMDGVTSEDADGENLTEDMVDDFLNTIIDEKGGAPDGIITTFNIAKQLKKLVAPYRRLNDMVDVTAGFRCIGYESPNGATIPIIVDSNMPDGTLFAVESRTIDVKYLMRPSIFEMATTSLVDKSVMASFVTAQNSAPFKSGILTNVGDGSEGTGSDGG